MTDVVGPPPVTITAAPAAGVHALELWDAGAAARIAAAIGFALPGPGRSAGGDMLRAIRAGPAVWLLDGETLAPAALVAALGDDGALTAIGGGLVRVRLAGPGWRALLMADAVFDAEDPHFAPGHMAATIIAHVPVRLCVIDAAICEVLVPASFADGLIAGWTAGTGRSQASPAATRDFA